MPPKKTMGQIQEEKRVEQQIQQVYEEAPVKRTKVREGTRFVFKEYYAPTPSQQSQIVKLAEQLPPEKAEKYITVEEPKAEPKGIAETLMGTVIDVRTKIPISTIEELTGEKGVPRWFPIAPAYGFAAPVGAGTVASVESLVYGGERLVSHFVTHHEPITPKPPPTLTGGLIGVALGDPSEFEKVQEYGPFYSVGTVAGDILLAYGIGKGLEKPTTKIVQWAAGTRPGQYIGSKIPSKLKNLFYKTELEVQRRYDPHARYALKQARYRPHYGLKSDLGRFIQSSQVKTGIVHTPYSATLGKTIEVPTRTGQVLLQKSVQETARQLPTLTLTKTVSPVVRAIAPKVVTATVSPTTLTKVALPFLWTGTKFPSILKTDIWSKTGVKMKPYPVVSSKVKVELEKLTETFPVSITVPKISPIVSPVEIVSPIVSPVQEVKVAQVQEVKQIQRQQLKQLQIQRQSLIRQQIQIPDWLMLDRPTRRRRKKKGTKPSGFYGRYPRFYPVKGARETLEMLVGI